MYNVSIGIMAYNEELNIGRLLDSVMGQLLPGNKLKEIIVVASGCSDGTVPAVRSYLKKDKRIHLIEQEKREGKSSAINLFLSKATGDILIIESADTIPEEGTLGRLIAPFSEPGVGMTGARPVPVNSKDTFIGYTVQLMWGLHHQIALTAPKLGELIAFRNIVKEIPVDSAVDEASIEAIIVDAGYTLRYVSDAIVINKGPDNVSDFIRQRRRIAAGHMYLSQTNNYRVSTTNPWRILHLIFRNHTWGFRETLWSIGTICLEFTGRLLGYYDYAIRGKNPFIWDIASSTKKWDR
jgi:biofilm PGA synthesis N-glycosyltransferase PgaC